MDTTRSIVLRTRGQQIIEGRFGKPVEDLIRERYERGLTQEQIADELGISRATVMRWMTQLGIPTRFLGPRQVA